MIREARPAKLVYPLVCTVSTIYSANNLLPRDGLCGYLFYDSLYKGGANSLAGTLSRDVDAFADRAKHNTFTEFGMSFAIDNANLLAEYTTQAFQRGLDALVQKQVIHYGVLDLHLQMTTNDTVAQALTILKRVNDHIATTAGTRTRQSLMAMGISLDDSARRTYIVRLMKTIFKPHLFISMAHIPYRDADMPDCMILPSSVHHYPPGVTATYGHTMNDSLALLQYLEDEQVFTSMAVGLTMKGHRYKPRDSSSPDSYGLFKKMQEVVMVFDSTKGMKNKFCDLKQHYLNLSYGVAAYDVLYDSVQHPCTSLGISGPYSRVDFLTRLRDFRRAKLHRCRQQGRLQPGSHDVPAAPSRFVCWSIYTVHISKCHKTRPVWKQSPDYDATSLVAERPFAPEPQENWELECDPNRGPYKPAVQPMFRRVVGLRRDERQRYYETLLERAKSEIAKAHLTSAESDNTSSYENWDTEISS
ncbi:hypothetical protein MRX96_022124 [Rhipicephalus microplus]